MSKEERTKKAPPTQKASIRIVFSAIFMAASLLLDFYAMFQYPDLLWLAGAVALVFILAVYCFANSIMQYQNALFNQREEMHNELFKSSKATYLMLRKYFDEVQEQLDDMEDKMGIPVDDIMNAQKGIAKITISRNKENADALMNSNDKLLDKVIDFEDKLDAIETKLMTAQKDVVTSSIQDILMRQQELSNLVKEIEVSLRKEILSLETSVKSMPQQPVMMMPQMAASPMPSMAAPEMTAVSAPEMPMMEEPAPEMSMDMEAEVMPEVSMDMEAEAMPEVGMDMEAEAMPEVGMDMEAEAMPEVSMDAEMPIPDDKLDEMVSAAAAAMEEETAGFDAGEEPLGEVISFEEATAEIEPEPIVEEAVAEPEPAADPMAEAMEDPNHQMTPDEIAAMLAAMDQPAATEAEPVAEEAIVEPEPVVEEAVAEPEPVVEEAVAEPEPVVEEAVAEPEPEPAVEEKPAMPDMSDPGHVMTPDEIAALLANM